MICLDEGTLRAFVDGELEEGRRREVERHVAGCGECRQALEEIEESSSWVRTALGRLDAGAAPDVNRALSRFRQQLAISKEKPSIWHRLGSVFVRQHYRLVAAAVAVVFALSIAFAYPPVRSTADGLLAVFRVQKFEAVRVEPKAMPRVPMPTKLGEFAIVQEPDIKTVASIDEARKRVDFTLRVPGNLPSPLLPNPIVMVSGSGEAAFTIDLEKVKAYLTSIGVANVDLPSTLDGATVKVKLTPYVGLIYGDGTLAQLSARDVESAASTQSTSKMLFVAEGRSPVIEAPSDADFEKLRNQLLQIPGLPPEFVAQLRSIQDWRQTLPIPVVEGMSKEITVDGTPGLLLISQEQGMVVAVWQKNDVLYAVGGNVAESQVLEVANSLK